MFEANVFNSQYGFLFISISAILGLLSIFIVRDAKDFRALLSFQAGAILLLIYFYFADNDNLLYNLGLNYDYITFLKMTLTLLTSALWINSAAEFYSNKPANREMLTLYISLGTFVCFYNAFIFRNPDATLNICTTFTVASISLLLLNTLLKLKNHFNGSYILLNFAILILLYKLIISAYFYKYGWLNFNLLNYLWIYIFIAAIVFLKFNLYRQELEKAWIACDKLNMRFATMVDSAPFPIIIARLTDGRLLMINSRAANSFGITKKEINYHKIKDFFVDSENRAEFMKILETTHEVEDFDLMVCDLINASPFWLSVSAKTIEYNNEMALYMAFQDVTSRKTREKNLQSQADKDPLTKAWNRRYFENKVPSVIENSIRLSQNFSLLMIDADNFKKLNDTYGHKTGDEVLIELVRICQSSLRENDIVARFGGEEFIIYLDNTNTQSAQSVAERLRAAIENTSVAADDNSPIHYTVSIGVVSSEKTSSLEILLRQVDDAMYLAKNRGRNQVAIYDEQEVKKLAAKIKKTARLEIHPVFQNEENEEISLLDNFDTKIL